MPRGADLQEKLTAGGCVLLDGAIGTELERLGAPMHQEIWCGHAIETHPELIAEVHRTYIEAGAEVITANTYTIGHHSLSLGGLEHKTIDWNQRAVAHANDARQKHAGERAVYVAGSVSSYGSWDGLDESLMRDGMAEQARLLVEEGVDLLILETLAAPPSVVMHAVDAAIGLGVPVWLSLSCMEDKKTGRLMSGAEESRAHEPHHRSYAPFSEVIGSVSGQGVDAILMMHSELIVTDMAVKEIVSNFDGPAGVYPNAGYWKKPEWAFVDAVSPDEFAARARNWIGSGAQIVGGCCGIGPEHIAALHASVPELA